MIRTFIQVTALMLALIATIFLAKSSLTISAEDIARLSSTAWGHNKQLVKNLSQQQTNAKAGVILLLTSFLLQIINILWPMRYKDFGVSKTGAIIAVCFSIFVFAIFLWKSKAYSIRTQKNIERIIAQKREQKRGE